MSAFQEQIDAQLDAAEAISAKAIAEARGLTPDEQTTYDGHFAKAEELAKLERSQNQLAAMRASRPAPAAASADAMSTAQAAVVPADEQRAAGHAPAAVTTSQRDPGHYRKGSHRSYFQDMYVAGDKDADPEARKAAAERLEENTRFELEQRAINTSTGTGGNAVAPTYLQQEYVELLTSHAPVLDRFTRMAYTASMGRTVNIPKLSTGTAVAKQSAENAAVQKTDIADTLLSANVYTIAGGQDVSLQLMEHSNPGIDQIVLRDLAKRVAIQKAQWALNGSGSGQPLGLAGTSSIGTQSFTTGSPTFTLLWPILNAAVNDVATGIFQYPTDIVMAVRRWTWSVNARDTQNRPLISAVNPMNALGTGNFAQTGVGSAEGGVGRQISGVPVTVDGNVITTDGGSTNQDQIFVGCLKESYLWESGPSFAVSYDEKFSNGTVVFRVMEDMAFLASRQPKSISLITGTGLVTPVFS